jgi:hypothetical protein
MTVVAVHQPNFLPWLGFFHKLESADVFVLLDDVQLQKTAGSWVNRVRVLVSGEPHWLTAPIVRPSGTQTIAETRVDDSRPWRDKLLRTVDQSYRRAEHFDAVFPVLEELLRAPTDRVAELNELAIRRIVELLGIGGGTRIVRSSELEVDGAATERLANLTRALGGHAYLSGGGASDYQDESVFEQAGIELRFQEFEHPSYAQRGEEFVAGLSVIDALLNEGPAETRTMLAR